ncbi:MAG: DUF1579 domain-containing protein [Pseudomonadota bacterium]|nr:DUF1579 domain-containing protein [Pseudomonadota bacterium]
MNDLPSPRPGMHAFAFQTGSWRVKHRKLRHRLAGSNDWFEFPGTCKAWELLDGAGNVDDHFLDDPAGAYRAITTRCLDIATHTWSLWWFDGRSPTLDPPVIGRFQDGVGSFFGDDIFEGHPIKVRFIWSQISPAHARWEQAFSNDGGKAWETNWIMIFDRMG